jgi:hypothetical protein
MGQSWILNNFGLFWIVLNRIGLLRTIKFDFWRVLDNYR